MNLHDKSWNEHTVRQVFSVDLADKILHTPLLSPVDTDRIVWKAERNGRYSVRSAYRLCVSELVDSSHLRRPSFWMRIWHLKVPQKVKTLIWRICRGCLPMRVRLLDKGVNCPPNCASCDSEYEDYTHVFFTCPFAIQVWNTTDLYGSIQHALSTTALGIEAIFSLLQNLSVELSQRFTTAIWSIWKHRNLRVWDDVTESSALVVERARTMIVDWELANAPNATVSTDQILSSSNIGDGSSTSVPHHGIRWQHPLPGRYKCNIDAAFSTSLNRTEIGICIRELDGSFVLARTEVHPCLLQTDVGEALGLHLALQ